MKPKTLLIYLISIILLITLTAATSHAVEVTCFSKDYTREKGKPVTITDPFYSAHEGTGTVKVTTNAKVTGAKITLNGQVLWMQGDFKEKITYYEKEVALHQNNNTIEVYDESKPGAWLQVEITHQVNAAAAAYIGSSGGGISTPGGCSANIPPDALSDVTLITINSLSATPDQIGSIYEFGPSGTFFSQMVTLTVPYDPALLPSNVLEEDLFLASIDDYMEILEDIQIDTINHRVSGRTLSFSKYALGAYYFTGVNTNDFSSIATSFRMPIGDNGIEDLGNDLNLLNRSNWTEFNYPKISFNLNEVSNNWYVATAFNKDRWLNNRWAEPSPEEDDVYGCDSLLSSIYSCNGSFHPGEDWNMLLDQQDEDDLGKSIHAVADGIVLLNQNQGKRNDGSWISNNFGNIIIIGHKLADNKTIASVYAHMQNKSSYEPGDTITKGDVIGSIGTSGGVPSHLHFEITKENNVLLKIEQNGEIKIPAIDSEDLIKGWYWPGTDSVFISNNYQDPSEFIQEHYIPPQPEQKLTAYDGAAGDKFGFSISISGDYAIVGSRYDDDKGTQSGSAYIFKRSDSTWTELPKITASDGGAYDYFGTSVAISGDYAIVGAPQIYYGWGGVAYIFQRSGSTWTQTAKLTASDKARWHHFGSAVSISGDYAVVGDPRAYGEAGSAYIFKRSGTIWTEVSKLRASDAAAYDNFGFSVAISGDYAIVGANHDDWHSGSAYIFQRSGSIWTQTAKLTASDGATEDRFGWSVAISGDYAIVGSNYDDDDEITDSGSAYVFEHASSTWNQVAKLTASDGAAYDYFGGSVAISGDYAIIGAYGDDDKGSSSGSAYIFQRSGSTWTHIIPKLTAIDGVAGDAFGYSVAISGNHAIIGAVSGDGNNTNSGSAYIYSIPSYIP